MKALLRLAARVYPRVWRERYGVEFAALLEDSGSGWRVLADVIWGAMKMRVTTVDFRLVVGLGLAGLAIAAVVSFQIPNRYRSEAVGQMTFLGEGGNRGTVLTDAFVRAESETLSRTALADLMQTPGLDLYKTERQTMPIEDVIEQMKARDIRIEVINDPQKPSELVFKVSYLGGSPAIANKVTQRILASLIDNNLRKAVSWPGLSPQRIEVLDPASMPHIPLSPNRPWIVFIGLMAGLAVGILIVGIRRWPRVALMGAGGAILAGALSFAIPDRYGSAAVLWIRDVPVAEELTRKVLANQEAISDILRGAGPGTTRDDVSIRQTSEMVQIRVVSRDRRRSQEAVRRVINALLSASGASSFEAASERLFEVVDPPSLPVNPIFPNRFMIAATGLVAGLSLATLLGVLRRKRPKLELRPA